MTNPELQTSVDLTLLDGIYMAQKVIAEPASPVLKTEMFYDEILSEKYDADVWLASELHQPIGAYKIRGAYNFVQNMTDSEKHRGVVTASAGNHGQGIALSGNLASVDNHIFMPETTPENKVASVSSQGGDTTKITLAGKTFDESEAFAKKYCDETGAVFAHPFNDRRVIAGQGTWGLEIAAALPDVDFVFCPVGGMGLLAGISTAMKYDNPNAEIVGVEPAGAASMMKALERGHTTALPENLDTFVDGAAVRQVGQVPFSLARHLVSQVVSVSNAELCQTTTELWEREQPIRVELAAALAITGLQKNRQKIIGKSVVCLLSGGNLSQTRYDNEVKTHESQPTHSR